MTPTYDLSEFDEFLCQFETPQQLCDELVELLFNYALSIEDDNVELFRNDVGTIQMLYSEIKKIKTNN